MKSRDEREGLDQMGSRYEITLFALLCTEVRSSFTFSSSHLSSSFVIEA